VSLAEDCGRQASRAATDNDDVRRTDHATL
jgi:hypothetical protein